MRSVPCETEMAFLRIALTAVPKLGFGMRACDHQWPLAKTLSEIIQGMRFARATKHVRIPHLPDELALRNCFRSIAAQRGPHSKGFRRSGTARGFSSPRVGASLCSARRVPQGTSGVALRRFDGIWSLWPDTIIRNANYAQQNADRCLPARGNKGCGAARKQGRGI